MLTVLSDIRKSNLYLIVAVTIVAVVFLTLAVVRSSSVREPAAIPDISSQNGYVEFLSGEGEYILWP